MAVRRADPRVEALVADVLADPEDDTRRLVLADHLQDRGDPRGELISLQCAAIDEDDEVSGAVNERDERAAALIEDFGSRWTEGLVRTKTITFGFERGFPSEVRGPAEALIRHLPRLAGEIPLVAARVESVRYEEIASLLSVLAETGVRRLSCDSFESRPFIEALVKSSVRTQLESLSLPTFVDALSQRPMPQLRRLRVDRDTYDRNTMLELEAPLERLEAPAVNLPRLAKAPFAKSLKVIHSAGASVSELVDLDLPNVTALDVTIDVTEKEAAFFSRVHIPIRSATVVWSRQEVSALSLARALAAPGMQRVVRLTPPCRAEHLEVLANAVLPRLRALVFSAGNVHRASSTESSLASAKLLAAPFVPRLRTLDLEARYVGDAGAVRLAGAPFDELRTLEMRDTGVGPKGAVALASSLQLRKLTTLDLSENALEDEGALALANPTGLPALRRLLLNYVRCTAPTTRALKSRYGGGLERYMG